MNLWHFFTEWLDAEPDTGLPDPSIGMEVNPANGLPMLEGTGLDIEGNPYGTDDFDPSQSDFMGCPDD